MQQTTTTTPIATNIITNLNIIHLRWVAAEEEAKGVALEEEEEGGGIIS